MTSYKISNKSFSSSNITCKYNLRNRGPPMFTVLAEMECPICLSDLFEKPVIVNCGHTFCDHCIQMVMDKHKCCPICNQVLIVKLFLSDTCYTRKLTRKNGNPMQANVHVFCSVEETVDSSPVDGNEYLKNPRSFNRQTIGDVKSTRLKSMLI